MPYITQHDIPEDHCAICVETLKDPSKAVFKLPCGHMFHNNCLNDYCNHSGPSMTTICPICRQSFNPLECNTFYAFKEKALNPTNLPNDVLNIYNNQEGGNRNKKKNNKNKNKNKITRSKKHCKMTKKRKSKKHK